MMGRRADKIREKPVSETAVFKVLESFNCLECSRVGERTVSWNLISNPNLKIFHSVAEMNLSDSRIVYILYGDIDDMVVFDFLNFEKFLELIQPEERVEFLLHLDIFAKR